MTTLAVLDVGVRVTGDPSVLARVEELWRPFVVADAAVDVDLEADGPSLLPFAAQLNRTVLERTPLFAVHAGVIASGERTVAFPAVSGAGKTTMVGAALRAGWDYVSDEALCVDRSSGAVRPYPRPLGVTPWTADALGLAPVVGAPERLVAPRELGGDAVTGDRRLTDVVLLRRGAGTRPALRPLARTDAVHALLQQSFNHHRWPDDAFRLATSLAADAATWELVYDTPADGATAVGELR